MSIHFLFILQMYFHKKYISVQNFFFVCFFFFKFMNTFSQRLVPTTVTQQAAQVQVFLHEEPFLGARPDTGSGCVEAFKGHTDAVQVLWYKLESRFGGGELNRADVRGNKKKKKAEHLVAVTNRM